LPQLLRGETGDLFFTAGFGEVDPTFFHAIQDRADQVWQAERLRHGGVEFTGSLLEVIEVVARKDDRLQLVRRSRAPFLCRWHEVHETAPIEE
jgi:hypothetical protein